MIKRAAERAGVNSAVSAQRRARGAAANTARAAALDEAAILVALVVLVGLLPQLSVGLILKAAAGAVLPAGVPEFKLAVWHGWNLPLAMSIAAFGLGLTHYWRRQHLFDLHERYLPRISSRVAFERLYRNAGRAAAWLLHAADSRSLQRYVALFLCFALLLAGWSWWSAPGGTLTGTLSLTPLAAGSMAALAALVVGAVGTVAYHRQRLTAVVFMSVVGLIVALTFIRYKAPDLALTQLSVEVVTIVLLLLALRYLPGEVAPESSRSRKARDAGLSLLVGGGVGALTYAVLMRPFETISSYHLANSVPGGGGTNVVNVILVDFRAFDTLGEITVLAMAALGLHALLDGLRLTPCAGSARNDADRHPIKLAQLQPLLPLALAVSVYIFLRGHNLPGGGFIAGLIAAVALMLQYLASGIDFAEVRLRVDYIRVLGLGLAIAVATGLASALLSYPFLTSTYGYVHPPVIEQFELASALAFDLGVFLVVVASVLLSLSELGVLSRREIGTAQLESTRG
jgi:multicomponent K+:H+ antiporter subunit A